jgi:hypothetical protein
MLTGRPPLSASSPLKLLRKITTEPIPSIRSQCPDLPADVAAWLDRLVAPDPLDRFPSAASAAAALVALPAAAAATTDLRFMPPMGPAAPPPMPDAAPWHRRATPAADRSRGSAADARLEGVLDRAAILEASGHDLLGEQTVTDIARELNLDAGEVRAILRAHRQGRGGRGRDADSIAGVFGEALGQQDRRSEDGDRWGGASPRVDDRLRPRGPRSVFVGAYLGALAVALAILLMFGARSVSTARPQPPPPRPVGVAREVVSVPLPQAEADPSAATLPNAFPGHSIPSAQPPNVPPGAVATPFLAPPPRQIFLEIFGNLTVMSAVLLLGLFALGFALAGHAIRRLMRNWP